MGRFLKNRELKSGGYGLVLTQGPTSLRPPAPVPGEIRFNTDLGELEAYYSSTWNSLARIGTVTITKDTFTGDTSTSTFNMSVSYSPGDEAKVLIIISGVHQNPGVSYTVNGTSLIFSSPPPLGVTILALHGYASTNA